MVSVDRAAVVWSIIIVIIAVGIATVGDASEDMTHAGREGNNMAEERPAKQMALPLPYGILPSNNMTEERSAKQIAETSSSVYLYTDKTSYVTNDKIEISGYVTKKLPGIPMAIIITDSNEELITISQLDVNQDGEFAAVIMIGGPLWELEGSYVIKAHYGDGNTAKRSIDLIVPAIWSDTPDVFNVNVGDENFPVYYGITNASIQNMLMDADCVCLLIFIEAQDNGILNIDLPRGLMNASVVSDGKDDMFVLLDGDEIPYREISSDSQSRKIQIEIEKGSSEIEIIRTNWI